jgi:hypothetical protein
MISRDRDMQFRGQPHKLSMIRKLWVACGDTDRFVGVLLLRPLAEDHSSLDLHSWMRCFLLAMQIFSRTVIQLIDDHTEKYGGSHKQARIKDTPPPLDRLVDTMNVANTTQSKHGHAKEFNFVDSPNYPYQTEMIELLETLSKWKQESDDSNHCIPHQSFEDFHWLILGTCCLAKKYLSDDPAKTNGPCINRNQGLMLASITSEISRARTPNRLLIMLKRAQVGVLGNEPINLSLPKPTQLEHRNTTVKKIATIIIAQLIAQFITQFILLRCCSSHLARPHLLAHLWRYLDSLVTQQHRRPLFQCVHLLILFLLFIFMKHSLGLPGALCC